MKAIYQWVLKAMMKNNTGVVQTLPKRDLMELNARITAERLMRNGIDPNELKNANQVENAINSIDNPPKSPSIPSTILNALIQPITANTVIIGPAHDRLTSPSPNILPNVCICASAK